MCRCKVMWHKVGARRWRQLGPSGQPLLPLAQSLLSLQLGDLKVCSSASMLPCLCLVWRVSDIHPPPDWVLFKGRNQLVSLSFSPSLATALPKAPCLPQGSRLGWAGWVVCAGFCQGLPGGA